MSKLPFTGKRVLVTGASAGIGAATGEAFCALGADVIAVGRRAERLEALAEQWAHDHAAHVTPVQLDVTDRDELLALAKKHKKLLDVDILVNNAGLARGRGPFHEGRFEDWQEMVDTNILALLSITREVLPRMVKRGSGHIVNLGSVAGRWTYPGGNVYSATKAAVSALTEGLRQDLIGTGIRVSNIEPGLVETEFSVVRYRGDRAAAKKVYADMTPLRAEDVADTITWVCSRPAHVNVQELVLYPTDQADVTRVHRVKKE